MADACGGSLDADGKWLGYLSADATRRLAVSNAHLLAILAGIGLALCIVGGAPLLLLLKQQRPTALGRIGGFACGLVVVVGVLLGALVVWFTVAPRPVFVRGGYDQSIYDRAFYFAAWEPASALMALVGAIVVGIRRARSFRHSFRQGKPEAQATAPWRPKN